MKMFITFRYSVSCLQKIYWSTDEKTPTILHKLPVFSSAETWLHTMSYIHQKHQQINLQWFWSLVITVGICTPTTPRRVNKVRSRGTGEGKKGGRGHSSATDILIVNFSVTAGIKKKKKKVCFVISLPLSLKYEFKLTEGIKICKRNILFFPHA